jgi:flagellar biosynthetic protein FliR
MTPGVLEAIVKQTSGVFSAGLLIAAPLIAVSFIITLIFVVLSRAVPQMNVFVESFAFRIMAGLAVFALTIHLMAQHIANYTRHLPEDMLRVAQLLHGG